MERPRHWISCACCCSPTLNSLHLTIHNLSLGYVRHFELQLKIPLISSPDKKNTSRELRLFFVAYPMSGENGSVFSRRQFERATEYSIHARMAEVARGHEGPPPKSLDSDENFKPEHTLICRKLRFVAIYALFGEKCPFLDQKQCFLGKKCTITWYILHILLS